MRKIESLQKNEVIEIRNKKEAKKIGKLVKIEISTLTFPSFVCKENNAYWVSQVPHECRYKLPASDFIKKSKTKQRLKSLEARMDKIEQDNTVTYSQDPNYKPTLIEVKDEPKLEVLPEKWCVEMDRQEVVDYCNIHGRFAGKYTLSGDRGCYAHFPDTGNGTSIGQVDIGYTLISFDDFKRLVLDQPKEIDFSVAGQLVAVKGIKLLVLTDGKCDSDNFSGTIINNDSCPIIFHRGFHSKTWVKNEFTLATEPFTINPQP